MLQVRVGSRLSLHGFGGGHVGVAVRRVRRVLFVVVRLPFFIATFAVVFVEVLESISCFLPDLCVAWAKNAHTRKAYTF